MDTVKVAVHHLGNNKFVSLNKASIPVMMDTADPRTGHGPMELLLGGLAGCTAFDFVVVMEKKKINLTHYRVEAEGERADEHPRKYTKIIVTHYASGEGLTEEILSKYVNLSSNKYCSVKATLNCEIEIRTVLLENM